jgi:hypothetical protein
MWRAGNQVPAAKLFWRLVAIGWAINVVGNIAWGAYEMLTGEDIPVLSLVDALYATRYALALAALKHYPGHSAKGLRWPYLAAIVAGATAMVWAPVYRPTLMAAEVTLIRTRDFVGVAMYPVLDTMVIYSATVTWVDAAKSRLRSSLGILILALVAYSIANWFQFGNRAVAGFTSSIQNIFWPLSDILAGLAAAYVLWQTEPRGQSPDSPTSEWIKTIPYVGGLVVIGVTIIDIIIQHGHVDPVLTTCCAIALIGMAGTYWIERKQTSPP